MQLACRYVRPDGDNLADRHRPRIEAFLHLHHHDAGLPITRHHRPLDRRRAAPARQQRTMQIEAAMFGRVEHWLGQQQAIGHHHRQLGSVTGKDDLLGLALERPRREHRNAETFRRQMHRRLALLLPAPGRLGRPCIDRDDLMPRRNDLGQRRHGKFGRAHENDAHTCCSSARRMSEISRSPSLPGLSG
jgi:hypothetical protein